MSRFSTLKTSSVEGVDGEGVILERDTVKNRASGFGNSSARIMAGAIAILGVINSPRAAAEGAAASPEMNALQPQQPSSSAGVAQSPNAVGAR